MLEAYSSTKDGWSLYPPSLKSDTSRVVVSLGFLIIYRLQYKYMLANGSVTCPSKEIKVCMFVTPNRQSAL